MLGKLTSFVFLFYASVCIAQVNPPTRTINTVPKVCGPYANVGGSNPYCDSKITDDGTNLLYNGNPISGGGPPTGNAGGALTGIYPSPTLSSTASTTPTGATPYTITLAQDAAKSGVLLDTFHQAGDADDTASLTRAMTACVPVALGARTYTINNFSSGTSCSTFILKGIKGQSIIQRTSASGSQFFQIQSATVYIDGVTFDSNKASVTANQWGVLMNQGGQSMMVQNSVFKNNSGSLGSCFAITSTGPTAGGWFNFTNNEVTGCTHNSAYFGSVYQGLIQSNYVHDNSSYGIYVTANGSPSSTNYSSDILISANMVMRNANSGIQVGGFLPPYVFGTPYAVRIASKSNVLQDNGGSSGYEMTLQGDYLSSTGDQISQSSSSVTVFGGIDCNARYSSIQNANINVSGASFGIDCGGSLGATITGNTISLDSGVLIDVGGNTNATVSGNKLFASGTAIAVLIYAIEADGNLVAFPTITSAVSITGNTIFMDGANSRGVEAFDNAGGFTGAHPIQVTQNSFWGQNSAVSLYAIYYHVAAGSIYETQNTWDGTTSDYVTLSSGNDAIFDDVFDEVHVFTSTGSIRSVINTLVSFFGGGSQILWVYPTSGGSGYTSATVINVSCAGLTGFTALAQISQGSIAGVHITNGGSGCTGTPTASATDTGGGTGAVLAVSSLQVLPRARREVLYTNNSNNLSGNLLLPTGGYIRLIPGVPVYSVSGLSLEADYQGMNWYVGPAALSSYPVGSLPTCNAAAAGAQAVVTGSAVNGWLAQCDGTNWRFPNGTVVS